MAKSPKKKKSRAAKGTPARIKLIVGLLIVLLLAGVGSVKYFKSTRGMALLLDSGFAGYYPTVQDAAGKKMLAALKDQGFEDPPKESRRRLNVGGKPAYALEWDLSCQQKCDLLEINLALTRAVRKLGLKVRESIEEEKGTVLRFEAGTRKYRTHLIIIRSARFRMTKKIPGPKLAIVIDDFGYARSERIEAFFNLDFPVTVSILPSLPHSNYAAARAKEAGKEMLLHLPMEAMHQERSDVDVVRVEMSDRRIRVLVRKYLRDMPGVAGVNNHQGSRATQDKRVMKTVLMELKKQNLYFFDSLTSAKSIAYNTARQVGVGTARNDLFLDAETEDPDVVISRLKRLINLAKRDGQAVGIGHPKAWTLEALMQAGSLAAAAGVHLVPLSQIIE